MAHRLGEALAQDWRVLPAALDAEVMASFGVSLPVCAPIDHPALAWRRAGLMEITGSAKGPALVAPVALTTLADRALAMLQGDAAAQTTRGAGARLLGERARLMGLSRRGGTSPNGSCRLLHCADGTIALNLPRDDDWALVPALVEDDAGSGPWRESGWEELAATVRSRSAPALVERGRLMGLAVALAAPARRAPLFRVTRSGASRLRGEAPLIVDLSALWAGPLAASLLGQAGGRVIKVESAERPDGARRGHAGFYALLNRGKEERVLDLRSEEGRADLRALIGQADIVIEASRPRALRQLGIVAEEFVAQGVTWLSITAYGREGAAGDAIGFGDDVAIAGGVSHAMRTVWGSQMFAGDAIADPLAGILAALGGWLGWRAGGGRLIALAMADVVAFACCFGVACRAEAQAWQDMAEADNKPLYLLRR